MTIIKMKVFIVGNISMIILNDIYMTIIMMKVFIVGNISK